ncbi:MAG: 6-phosphogluconolactonase, partial [Candidatus Omnitrophota bacterium]
IIGDYNSSQGGQYHDFGILRRDLDPLLGPLGVLHQGIQDNRREEEWWQIYYKVVVIKGLIEKEISVGFAEAIRRSKEASDFFKRNENGALRGQIEALAEKLTQTRYPGLPKERAAAIIFETFFELVPGEARLVFELAERLEKEGVDPFPVLEFVILAVRNRSLSPDPEEFGRNLAALERSMAHVRKGLSVSALMAASLALEVVRGEGSSSPASLRDNLVIFDDFVTRLKNMDLGKVKGFSAATSPGLTELTARLMRLTAHYSTYTIDFHPAAEGGKDEIVLLSGERKPDPAGARLASVKEGLPPAFFENLSRYGFQADDVKFVEVVDGQTKELKEGENPLKESVRLQCIVGTTVLQALAAANYAGMAKQFATNNEPLEKTEERFGKIADGAAVTVGRKALEFLAKAYDITVVIAGNEGKTRDGSSALPEGMVINPGGKNGGYFYIGDSIEVTNGVKTGAKGSSSMMALFPVSVPFEIDGYRVSLWSDFPHTAGIDPIITKENSLEGVLEKLARSKSVSLPDLPKEYEILTLDRHKNDELIKEATALGFKVNLKQDGDPVPGILRALYGIPDKNGKKLIVISTGGGNEHRMAQIIATLYGRSALATTYASTKSLKAEDKKPRGSMEPARDWKPEDLHEFAAANEAITRTNHDLKLQIPGLPATPEALNSHIQDETSLAKEIRGNAAVGISSITGGLWLDTGIHREHLSPVTYTLLPHGRGAVEVGGFVINEEGRLFFFQINLRTDNLLESRDALLSDNDFGLTEDLKTRIQGGTPIINTETGLTRLVIRPNWGFAVPKPKSELVHEVQSQLGTQKFESKKAKILEKYLIPLAVWMDSERYEFSAIQLEIQGLLGYFNDVSYERIRAGFFEMTKWVRARMVKPNMILHPALVQAVSWLADERVSRQDPKDRGDRVFRRNLENLGTFLAGVQTIRRVDVNDRELNFDLVMTGGSSVRKSFVPAGARLAAEKASYLKPVIPITKILVVIDHPPTLRNFKSFFVQGGLRKNAEVVFVTDKAEAFKQLKNFPREFGLVFLGLNDPNESLKLARRLREEFGEKMPVIVAAGRPLKDEELEAIGNVDRVDKTHSINMKKLLGMVNNLALRSQIVVTSPYVFADETARQIADEIARLQQENKTRVVNVVFATGNTVIGPYDALSEDAREDAPRIDWSRVRAFHLDALIGLGLDEKGLPEKYSHESDLWENLLKKVPIPKENIHWINGRDPDLGYAKKIERLGGADIVILGVGKNAQLASNEPGSSFDSVMRVVDADFPNAKQVATLGLGDIMKGRKLFLLANGEAKADIIHETLQGTREWIESITEKVPASVVQKHPHLVVILDEPAARELNISFLDPQRALENREVASKSYTHLNRRAWVESLAHAIWIGRKNPESQSEFFRELDWTIAEHLILKEEAWTSRFGKEILFTREKVTLRKIIAHLVWKAKRQALNAWIAEHGREPLERVFDKEEDWRIAGYVVEEFIPLYRERKAFEEALANFYVAKLLHYDLDPIAKVLDAVDLVGLEGVSLSHKGTLMTIADYLRKIQFGTPLSPDERLRVLASKYHPAGDSAFYYTTDERSDKWVRIAAPHMGAFGEKLTGEEVARKELAEAAHFTLISEPLVKASFHVSTMLTSLSSNEEHFKSSRKPGHQDPQSIMWKELFGYVQSGLVEDGKSLKQFMEKYEGAAETRLREAVAGLEPFGNSPLPHLAKVPQDVAELVKTFKPSGARMAADIQKPFELQLAEWVRAGNVRRPINRVLVNDDEPLIRNLVENILSNALPAAEIVSVDKSEVAWQKLQSESFDLVVTDRNTKSAETGTKLVERLRAKELSEGKDAGRQTLVVLASADLEKVLEEGINTDHFGPSTFYLAKPFKSQALVRLVSTVQAQGPRQAETPPVFDEKEAKQLAASLALQMKEETARLRQVVEQLSAGPVDPAKELILNETGEKALKVLDIIQNTGRPLTDSQTILIRTLNTGHFPSINTPNVITTIAGFAGLAVQLGDLEEEEDLPAIRSGLERVEKIIRLVEAYAQSTEATTMVEIEGRRYIQLDAVIPPPNVREPAGSRLTESLSFDQFVQKVSDGQIPNDQKILITDRAGKKLGPVFYYKLLSESSGHAPYGLAYRRTGKARNIVHIARSDIRSIEIVSGARLAELKAIVILAEDDEKFREIYGKLLKKRFGDQIDVFVVNGPTEAIATVAAVRDVDVSKIILTNSLFSLEIVRSARPRGIRVIELAGRSKRDDGLKAEDQPDAFVSKLWKDAPEKLVAAVQNFLGSLTKIKQETAKEAPRGDPSLIKRVSKELEYD